MKKKLYRRSFAGIRITSNNKSLPIARAVYEEFYTDGSRGIRIGTCISAKSGCHEDGCFPELGASLRAACELLDDIELACLEVDRANGIEETDCDMMPE